MKDPCLISVGQLCDDGFAINFDANHVYLQKGDLQLIGTRDPSPGLYYIDFDSPTPPPQVMNSTDLTLADTSKARAYYNQQMTIKPDLVQYLHRAAWSPLPSTCITVI